ncbi:MAG: hypothetical protein KDM64_12430, partial [Verrucomicrobiae bacterium]|nr:hypothetical protein [Verrucomicrobiae bacterium]
MLLDHSASMSVADGLGGSTRWASAQAFASALAQGAKHPEALNLRLFSESLGPPWIPGKDATPIFGKGTRLDLAGLTLLDDASERGSPWTGVVVISDGRQTSSDPGIDGLAARAKSLGIPFHTVTIGGEVPRRDVSVTPVRRQLVSLPDQAISVQLRVSNSGIPPVRATLHLEPPSGGRKIEPVTLEIATGATESAEFNLPPGSLPGDYLASIDPIEGDEIAENDTTAVHVRVLDKRTRIFLAEGAPYWDTKFLAQLLRSQSLMEVDAVYRLRPERFYRVTTGDTIEMEETTDVFPEAEAEFGRYDLIVLGKGAEAFLTPGRIDGIERFVRDRGGALLFSRGKPYSGSYDALRPLELGNWGEETGSEYTLLPTRDGAESGLFGERLPGPESAIWRGLPALSDVRSLAELRPFTRILAAGERVGGGAKVPLLMARRHGRGMVAAVNGDGLWRWGFNPTRLESNEDWHRDFWMQTLQWAATYSEFLPGEDYSLQMSNATLPFGSSVRVRIGYRGDVTPAPEPVIDLSGPVPDSVAAAEAGSAEDGTPRWCAILSPKEPGQYTVTLQIGGDPGPSLPLVVLPPPRESDEKSADPSTLETLSRDTGGSAWPLDNVAGLLAALEPAIPPTRGTAPVWHPLWNRPWILVILALLLGAEWTARRRLGRL